MNMVVIHRIYISVFASINQCKKNFFFLNDVSQLTQIRDDEKSQTYNSIVRIPMDLIDAKMSLRSERR